MQQQLVKVIYDSRDRGMWSWASSYIVSKSQLQIAHSCLLNKKLLVNFIRIRLRTVGEIVWVLDQV